MAGRRLGRGVPYLLAASLTASAGILAPVGRAPEAAAAGFFTVDSTGDADDADAGDGECSTAGGVCTLRAAITEANARGGHDTIRFAIAGFGPHRIEPATRLPILDDPAGVTIDGYSQAGARPNRLDHGTDARLRIELRGTGPNGIDGIEIRSPNNVISGLSMFDFKRHIRLFGDEASFNQIVGNFLGTDAGATFGQTERVTNANAIHAERGANNNRIGRPGNASRNLFAGNADKGVALFNNGTDFNVIQNNLFGLTPDGSARLANWGHGIDVNFNASHNLIGGASLAEGNVVAGNELSGIEISHNVAAGTTTGNRVTHNLIGTLPDGASAPAYARNREFGVNLEGRPRCSDVCDPDIEGNVVEHNVIVGSDVDVMIWKGAHDNRVAFNHIGVLADGTRAASSPETIWAVLIAVGAFDNLIERNVVAGVHRGIHLKPDNDFPADCYSFDTVCPADAVFGVFGNTFSKNSIDRIDLGLGIDLYERDGDGEFVAGPSVSPDLDVNGGVALPDIASVTTDRLVGTACPGCSVEVFVTDAPTCEFCWPEYGRGRSWVADGVADPTGSVVIDFRDSPDDRYVVAPGSLVAMLATDDDGNTSEFSLRVQATAGAVPAPQDTSLVELPVGVDWASPSVPGLEEIVDTVTVRAPATRCALSVLC